MKNLPSSAAEVSPYLETLVKENYLLTREAQAANRLPEALQEKAVEQSEARRVQAMEKIVFELLNPGQPRAEDPMPLIHKMGALLFWVFLISLVWKFLD